MATRVRLKIQTLKKALTVLKNEKNKTLIECPEEYLEHELITLNSAIQDITNAITKTETERQLKV